MFKHKKVSQSRRHHHQTTKTLRLKNPRKSKHSAELQDNLQNETIRSYFKSNINQDNSSNSVSFLTAKQTNEDNHKLGSLSKSCLVLGTKTNQNQGNKENAQFFGQSQKSTSFKQQQNAGSQGVLQQILQALNDLKNQNQYLLHRNSELEYVIEQDVKQKIDSGFKELKKEIGTLRKYHQQHSDYMKKFKMMTYSKRNRFASSKQLITNNLSRNINHDQTQNEYQIIQEQEEMDRVQGCEEEDQNARLTQLDGGAESTFIRGAELTQPIIQSESSQSTDMRQSIGANLLQIMQFNNNSKSKNNKRAVRNFNFRCNLSEIDKIIEEDCTPSVLNENQKAQETPIKDKKTVLQEIQEINESIVDHETNEKETSVTRIQHRPQTGIRGQRKGWGINPRKSIGKKRGNSKETMRPRTAQGCGLRIKGIPSSKHENEDPILALLRQDEEKAFQETVNPDRVENIDQDLNLSQEKLSSLQPSPLQQKTNDSPIKQQEIQIQGQKTEETVVPKRQVKMPIKRGMFKAPPSNLIEQLLLEESNLEDTPNPMQSGKKEEEKKSENTEEKKPSPVNFRQGRFIRDNNFSVEQSDPVQFEKSRSKSKTKPRNSANKFPGIVDLCDDEDENKEDENPFNTVNTLTKNDNSIGEDGMNNLFFHRKQDINKGDTAEFGK